MLVKWSNVLGWGCKVKALKTREKLSIVTYIYILPFSSPDEKVANGRSSKPIPDPALPIAPSASVEARTVDSYLPQRLTFFEDEGKAFARTW